MCGFNVDDTVCEFLFQFALDLVDILDVWQVANDKLLEFDQFGETAKTNFSYILAHMKFNCLQRIFAKVKRFKRFIGDVGAVGECNPVELETTFDVRESLFVHT